MSSSNASRAATVEKLRASVEAAVEFEPQTGCWLWSRSVDRDGYGRLQFRGYPRRANRAAWVAFRGPIPDGMVVLHRCDTPACVNPGHLRLGTQGDNVADCAAKGRIHNSSVEACKRGHVFTEANTYRRPQGDRECRTCRRLRGARR